MQHDAPREWWRTIALYSLILAIIPAALLSTSAICHGQNPIQVENAKPGTTSWQLVNSATAHEIEGYASLTSVNAGGQISFFVNTTDPTFNFIIYRLGWYKGLGGRQMTDPVDVPGTVQTIPAPDSNTGVVDCNWINPYVFTVPSDWVSGVYVAKLTGDVSGKDFYIIFVVRNDGRASDLLYQQSVTTYEAYNNYGGKSLYSYNSTSSIPQAQVGGAGLNSAVKVSFNRPYEDQGTGHFLRYEFDMVYFLEQQGYDVTYSTDVDTHTSPSQITLHKGFLTAGHDEYWSWEMPQNLTNALNHGVSLGFFSGDTGSWQIRFEPSAVTGNPDPTRTIVAYKEDASNDPDASNSSTYYLVTTEWRLPHVTLPPEPEDALIGVMETGSNVQGDILIGDTSSWVFNGTGLKAGDTLPGLLGYAVDAEFGDQPSNTVRLTHSPYTAANGSTQYGDMTVYQLSNGATVFAAKTIQWAWGLANIAPEGSQLVIGESGSPADD
jgi:hypothetical protein